MATKKDPIMAIISAVIVLTVASYALVVLEKQPMWLLAVLALICAGAVAKIVFILFYEYLNQ